MQERQKTMIFETILQISKRAAIISLRHKNMLIRESVTVELREKNSSVLQINLICGNWAVDIMQLSKLIRYIFHHQYLSIRFNFFIQKQEKSMSHKRINILH